MEKNEKGGPVQAAQKQILPTNLHPKDSDFSQYLIRITDDFPEPVPVIYQGDRLIGSRGNLVTITGKPKAFKTFLCTAILSAFLEDDCLGLSGNGQKALLIDTEQGKGHVHKVLNRVYRLSGWDLSEENPRLTVLSLRELDALKRAEIALQAINETGPDLVIIDGIRDLVRDFNDITESSNIVGKLMRLSTLKNSCIVNVLHQNKADTNARGHLGSELCNKSETVLQVVNEDGIATVSSVYSRNREISPFSFRVNSEELPEGCSIPRVEKKKTELAELFSRAMFGSTFWTWAALRNKLMLVTGKSKNTAARRISEALEADVLKFNSRNEYYLAFSEVADDDEDLPFS